VSVILMLPTLIASIYGMNVPNGLETNAWGFTIAIAVSVMVAGVGYLFFKWRRWL
jgi:magnesium transporter